MPAEKRADKHSYGDSQLDLRSELLDYSRANGYVIDHYADAVCHCGGQQFELHVDEAEGVAGRVCLTCGDQHVMADGEDYLDEAELEVCQCLCGGEVFEITVGVHLYRDTEGPTEDVRWLYVGGRCPACGLLGCYADWKSEFSDYKELLASI